MAGVFRGPGLMTVFSCGRGAAAARYYRESSCLDWDEAIRAYRQRSVLLQPGSTSAVSMRSLLGAGSTRECGFHERRGGGGGNGVGRHLSHREKLDVPPYAPLAATSVVLDDAACRPTISHRRGSRSASSS